MSNHVSQYHRPFAKFKRGGSIWYLGYNTAMEVFVKYSPTNGPGVFQTFNTFEQLQNVHEWFELHDYECIYIHHDNILEYA